MISIKDLKFNYKKDSALFSGLSLELQTGHIYGLLGKNGAGKTTLLKIISGMIYPQEGVCTLNGINTYERKPKTFEDIFFIPEEFSLPNLTINNFAKIHAPFYHKFSFEQFHEYLNDFGIKEFDDSIKSLSYGQVKMVIFSFGLAANTKYLVLDEPTNGLDVPSKAILRRLLTSCINSERSFIISTHQIRDLESLIDPIVIIDNGKIVFHKKCEEIMQQYSFKQINNKNNEEVLYFEERVGVYNTICKNNGNEYTNINLELLFNGVTNTIGNNPFQTINS